VASSRSRRQAVAGGQQRRPHGQQRNGAQSMPEQLPADPANAVALPGDAREIARLLALGAVAGGVAHDFNNLLLAMQGFAGLAKMVLQSAGGNERVRSYLDEIGLAGQRAQLLVQQLSLLARARRPRLETGACPVVAGEVVAACAATFAEGLTLSVDVEDGLPAIAIDRSHLHRLWFNLVRNGCEAMDGAGTVLLSARRSRLAAGGICCACRATFAGDFVRVAVSDEGHGIAAAIRDRVFEPFFSSGRHRSGIGLGLTAVHALVHLAGGHLQIVDRPGGGTEMAVFLPLAGDEADAGA